MYNLLTAFLLIFITGMCSPGVSACASASSRVYKLAPVYSCLDYESLLALKYVDKIRNNIVTCHCTQRAENTASAHVFIHHALLIALPVAEIYEKLKLLSNTNYIPDCILNNQSTLTIVQLFFPTKNNDRYTQVHRLTMLQQVLDLFCENPKVPKTPQTLSLREDIQQLINNPDYVRSVSDLQVPGVLHENCTPLHRAVIREDAGLTALLIANDADVNVRNYHNRDAPINTNVGSEVFVLFGGQTPLQLASFSKSWDRKPRIVELLLKNKAKIDAQGSYGYTALHIASRRGNEATVELLLKNKAETDVQRILCGHTALHGASERGNRAIVELLLKNGANTELKTNSDQTALCIARKKADQKTIELLESRAAINSTNHS